MPTMNRMAYLLLFGFFGLYFAGLRRHFGLTWALIYLGTGLLIVLPTAGLLVNGLIEGPSESWVRGLIMAALLWTFFLLLRAFLTRPLQPIAASAEAAEEHPEVIDGWIRAGFTEWEGWRLRSGGRGLLLVFGRPLEPILLLAYMDGVRWKTVAASSLAGRRGVFYTTREAEGMLDLGELRQIVHPQNVEKLIELHEDGLDYLRTQGVGIDVLAVDNAIEFLNEDRRRSRAALIRFPIGFLGHFFRPVLHVGRLRTRPSRHWQLGRLAS